MDPQLKSILTSVGMTLSTSVAAWAVTHGIIHAADQAPVADAIVTAVSAGVTALLGWYKTRQHTPTAQIAAVNDDPTNGVKVVAEAVPAPKVTVPLKGPAK